MLCARALAAAGAELGQLDAMLGRFPPHWPASSCTEQTIATGVADTLRQLPAGIVKVGGDQQAGAWARRLATHLGLARSTSAGVLGEGRCGGAQASGSALLLPCAQAGVRPAEA